MSNPDFELLRWAYEYANSVPDKKLNLNTVMYNCGTIGCAIGWLGRHPKMQALGLSVRLAVPKTNYEVFLDGKEMVYNEAAAKVFNISDLEARKLFGVRGASSWDFDQNGLVSCTEKQVLKRRFEGFFKMYGQQLEGN